MGAELSRSKALSRVTAPREREILADFLEALRRDAAAGAVEFLSEEDRRRASPELLAAMACAEIEHRAASAPTADGAEATIDFQAPPRTVPQWLEAFPSLVREPACVVEVIAADFAARRRCGAAADARDYVEQFPQWAESISERLSQIDPLATVAVQPPEAPPRAEETQSLARSFDASTQAHAGSSAGRRVRTAHLAPDAEFGDYILEVEIARGGMGVVYKAVQRKLNRTVAVKMILSGNLASEQEVRRFYTEAEAAAHLDHPGIVPIYEVNEVDGQHFFSMGYVDGQSLQQRLASGPLPPREAAEIVRQTAEAISYAHEHGVVHRDLKPSNILLTKDGRPRVTDFGLAKTVEGDSNLTASGQILGTPGYMPPEQAMGNTHEVGPHSDVYSLGAVLYCLLTGRPPFQAATAVETLHQVIEREPARPRLLNPAVDLDLETICLKCLEKRKEHRIESGSELVAELTRYLAGEPIRSRRTGYVTRARRWIARNRMTAALVGLAPVLVAAIAAAIVFAGGAREERELSQLSRAFQAGLEQMELTPDYRREMEQLVTRIAARDPEEAARLEERLQSEWVAATDRAIRGAYLTDEDVERIESALAVLQKNAPEQAMRLRAMLDQRSSRWQAAFRLDAPFSPLAAVFTPGAVAVKDGKLYPAAPPSGESSGAEPSAEAAAETVHIVPTQVAAGPRVTLQAEFDAGWETGHEIGLTLNHGENAGYDFVLRPAPMIDRELMKAEDLFHYRATAPRLSFAQARRRGGRLLVEIRRNGSPVQKLEQPMDEVPPGPLSLWVKRDRGDLALQVNRGEPIELSDPFPISAARAGVFAVRWPEQAGLVSLKAEDVLRSGAVTPLEQADALYEEERYEDALSLYAQQGLESSEREVQQEARFKRGLCLMHLNRTDEAMQAFQPLVAEPGERWPPQAGVQLWLLLLRQNRYEDADAVYEVLASRFSFQDLATMVPADVRSEILAAYLRAFTSIGNALAFRPEQIRELERAAAVDRFLSYDGQGELMSQVDLSRGYRYLEDYESSLAVLEPIVRSTYHTVPWRHYMRTLRALGRADEALRESDRLLAATHSQERPNLSAFHDRLYIHAALSDWDALETEVLRVLDLPGIQSPAHAGNRPFFWLAGGFVRADRGDEPGAREYWRQGYRDGRSLLQKANTADSAVICVLIMGSLTGELRDDEAWTMIQSTIRSGQNPLLALAGQMVNERTVGHTMRRMWSTPHGREIARAFAYDTLTLRQRVEDLAKLAATQYAADVAFGGWPTSEQADVIWQALSAGLDQLVKEGRLNAAQVAQLGLSWKGTSNFLGWQGVAPSLDPSLRGPLAYLLAHRYVRLGKLPQAEQFLQTALDDAPADSPQARLAREELELLKNGQARLRLERASPVELEDAEVEVVVRRDGDEVQRISLRDIVEVDLAPGRYELALAAPGEWRLSASEVNLAAADRAAIHLSPVWRPAPQTGAVAGLLPSPADLPDTGRWQVIAREPLGAFARLAQHPRGEYIAASGNTPDGVVRVYDADLNLISAFPVAAATVTDMSWRPDGELLAVVGPQRCVELWDPLQAKLVARRFVVGDTLSSVAWSRDGARLAAGSWRGRVYVWNEAGDRLLGKELALGAVTQLAWRPDGEALTFLAASRPALWEFNSNAAMLLPGASEARAFDVGFLPDGGRIAAINAQGVDLWDAAGRHERLFALPAQYSGSLVWEADGASLWVRTDQRLGRLALNAAEGEAPPPVDIPASESLLYDPASGLFTAFRWRRRLVRFRSDGHAAAEAAELGSRVPLSVVWRPDGEQIVLADDVDALRILDSQGRVTREVETAIRFLDSCYSPDQTLLAGACENGWVRVYAAEDGSLVTKWKAHERPVRAVAFHPDGGKLATCGDDGAVRLWTLSGEPLGVLPDEAGLGRPLLHIAFSPDGARLAAASNHGNVYLWNDEGEAVATLETAPDLRDLAWRPDSSGLAAAVGHDLVICSRDGELQLQTSKPQGVILGCHWTDTGLLAADERGNVRVFDAAGDVVEEWSTGLAPLRSAKFDPQGRQMVVGLERGALYGWDLATRRPTFTAALVDDKVLAFDAAGRFLNEDETDISPLLYCVETPEGFRLMTHEEFAARTP